MPAVWVTVTTPDEAVGRRQAIVGSINGQALIERRTIRVHGTPEEQLARQRVELPRILLRSEFEREEVLDIGQPERLELLRIVGGIVRHQNRGILVEALD